MTRLWPLLPVLIDGVFILAFHLAVPALALRFRQRSLGNALLIGGVYVAVCVAAFFLKRLRPAGSAPPPTHRGALAGVAGLFFGFLVVLMLDHTSGFSATLPSPGNAPATIAVVLVAIGGIALALAFPLILLLGPGRVVRAGATRYHLSMAAGLIIVNTMVLCLWALWRAYFETDPEPYVGLTLSAKLLIFVFVYLLYLLFFSAPRLFLLSLDPRALAWASFLLSSAYFVWASLSRAAWQ